MGIEFLACFVLKTFDESCALGRQEVFRLRFSEGDTAYLTKDVEIATFTLALRHFGEDAHGVLTAHWTTISGILGLRYLQSKEFTTDFSGIVLDACREVLG